MGQGNVLPSLLGITEFFQSLKFKTLPLNSLFLIHIQIPYSLNLGQHQCEDNTIILNVAKEEEMPVKLRHAINCQLYFNFKDVKICVYVYIRIPLFIRLSFYSLECPTGLFTSSVSRL